MNNKNIYPFNEGDDYYTIDGNDIIWSCWDDQSEEWHTDDKVYFDSVASAKRYAKTNSINISKVYDHEKLND